MLICISSYHAFLSRKTNLPTQHNQTCLCTNINPYQIGACFLFLRIRIEWIVWLNAGTYSVHLPVARTAKCCCCGTAVSRVAAPWWCRETGVIVWLRDAAAQFLQRAKATHREGSCKTNLALLTPPNAGKWVRIRLRPLRHYGQVNFIAQGNYSSVL